MQATSDFTSSKFIEKLSREHPVHKLTARVFAASRSHEFRVRSTPVFFSLLLLGATGLNCSLRQVIEKNKNISHGKILFAI